MEQEQIKERLEAMRLEHALVWREVSLSPAWKRLSHIEGAIQELENLAACMQEKREMPTNE